MGCAVRLSATAGIDAPQLEAFPARTLEALVAGDRQMTTFGTNETPARDSRHWPKLVARDAVRAPNHRRIHRDIHEPGPALS